jgi:predicted lipid-binding transport protein (Tim44 family)
MRTRRALIWFVLLFPLLAGVCTHELNARFGGGGGYGGGGGGGGGGSGGGGGDGIGALIYLLIRLFLLLWDAGPVGKVFAILLLVGSVSGFIWAAKKKKERLAALNDQGRVIHSSQAQRRQSQGVNLIHQFDPNFSRVLFLDFARLVYVKLQESRGGLARRSDAEFAVAPYLVPQIREQVKAARTSVSEVIVGDVQFGAVSDLQDRLQVSVSYRANVVESTDGSEPVRFFLEQRFVFARPKSVITQPPEKVLSLGCPSCGSPQEPDLQGRCPSCGTVTGRGEMGWQVKRIETLRRERVGPPVGHKGGVEVGTSEPTIFAPDLNAQKRSLAMRDPSFGWHEFTDRTQYIFQELQQAWTTQDERRIRPYVTDTLYDTVRYWLARYREQGIREVLEDVTVLRLDIARIEHDAWFDAITMRIFAGMKEYQVNKDGRILSGSKDKTRRFSEYWTLIRRSDRAHKQSANPSGCPNCGAPLDRISRFGVCEYCNSRIVGGDFDWVLSLITQDEDYQA